MDINKWLESTVLPQQEPSLPEQLGLPPFLHPKENYKALLASADKQPRKRRHTTSNSSFLETRQHNQTSPIEHEVEIDNKSNDKLLTDASSSSDRPSSVGYASGHPYGRKPRHKTRPDIYEPKSDQVKERGMQKHRRGKGESKKTKGKSRRKKTEKPGIGLVQSFHARNVPKGRLTLKPREKLGIFNKGRASSPVRGRGLPDLVFSEMRFLQKREDAPGEQANPDTQRRRRRKNLTRANQEEVSAYFTTTRVVLAEKESNIQSKVSSSRQAQTLIPERKNKQQKSASINSAIPTIELPEKPYLGFGSRGTRHESTPRLSWSSSIRHSSETPVLRRALTTIEVGQLETVQARRHGTNININRPLSAVPDARRRRGNLVDSDRDRCSVSFLRPMSRGKILAQEPRSQLHSPQKLVLSNNSETKGLKPQKVISSSDGALSRRAKRLQYDHPKVQNDDSATSVVAHPECLEPQSRSQSNNYNRISSVKGEPELQTSPTLGKLLQECDSAFAKDKKWQLLQQYAGEMLTGNHTLADNDTGMGTNMEGNQEVLQFPTFALQQSWPLIPDHPRHYRNQVQGGDMAEHVQIYSRDIEGPESIARTDGEDVLLGSYEGTMPQAPDDSLSTGLRHSNPAKGLSFIDADEQERRDDEQGGNGVFAGFWRPNKLY